MAAQGVTDKKVQRNLVKLQRLVDQDDNYNDITACIFDIGDICLDGEDYVQALYYYQRALNLKIQVKGRSANHDSETAEIYNSIGVVLTRLKKYRQAVQHYVNSLNIFSNVPDETTKVEGTANVCNNIAVLLMEQYHYELAHIYNAKAMNMLVKLYRNQFALETELMFTYRVRGDILLHQKLLEDAMYNYQVVIELYDTYSKYSSLFVQNVVTWATTLASIGLVYHKDCDCAKAINAYEQALEFLHNTIPNADQLMVYATILEMKGDSLLRTNDFATAEDHYSQAQQIRIYNYGKEKECTHLHTVKNIARLANLYTKMFKIATAKDFYSNAITMCENIFSTDLHPEVAKIHNYFGDSLLKSGEYVKALIHHSKALGILYDTFGNGSNHPIIAETMYHMSQVYCELGDYDKGLEYGFKSLDNVTTFFQEIDFSFFVWEKYLNVGAIFYEKGNFTEAMKYYEQTIHARYGLSISELLSKNKWKPHWDLLKIFSKLALALSANGSFADSVSLMKESVVISRMLCDPTVEMNIRISKGHLYLIEGDFFKARGCFTRALDFYNNSAVSKYTSLYPAKLGMYIARCNFKAQLRNSYQMYIDDFTSAGQKLLQIFGEVKHALLALNEEYIGDCYTELSMYSLALESYNTALDLRKEIYKGFLDRLDVTDVIFKIGDIQIKVGLYSKALKNFLKCSAIRERLCNTSKNIGLAKCYDSVGNTYVQLQLYDAAYQYFQLALQIKNEIHFNNSDHLDLIKSYSILGNFFNSQGKYNEATENYKIALKKAENRKKFHPIRNGLEIARCCNNIGISKRMQGEWHQALTAHMTALAHVQNGRDLDSRSISVAAKPWAKEHISAVSLEYDIEEARTQLYIGLTYYGDGSSIFHIGPNEHKRLPKYQDAVKALDEAQELYEDVFESSCDSEFMATVYSSVGLVLQQKAVEKNSPDNYDTAYEYHQKALNIREQVFELNPNHLDIAISYMHIGYIQSKRHRQDCALAHYASALEKMQNHFGNRQIQPELANLYEKIGYAHFDKEELQQALEYYRKCLSIRVKLYGKFVKFHSELASIYNKLGKVFGKLGNKKESEKYFDLVHEITIPSARRKKW